MLFAVAIVIRVGYIQFAEGEKWEAMGERISFDYKRVKATRGNIYSDNGSLLATSLPFYKIAFDATIPKDEVFKAGVDSLAWHLSKFFRDKSKAEYKRMLIDARATGKQYIILNRRKVDYQDKKKMMQWPIMREGRLRGGAIFEKTDVRYMPFSNLGRRTIGFINENDRGAGLEYSFNRQLGGQDGYAYYQKIAGGVWKPIFDANNVKAVNGLDLQTTLDINLQDVAETALHKAMVRHNADDGMVVVMEVATGEVKAITNLSSEGNGNFSEKLNFAARLFEPGSTFKLVTMMALLEDSNIRLTDSIDTGNGEYQLYDHKVRDSEEGGFGKITIQDAFEVSSNVAMARLVNEHYGLKPGNFISYLDKLNLSSRLGIQIAGEPAPKIKRPGEKGWSGISLPWMAYGYGFEITPLHILALYNAVANDGVMIKPVIVKSVSKADENEETFKTNIITRHICSDATLKKLRGLLEGVVEEGTARNIKGAHYKIAGKTGTAQILQNGRYTRKYVTSFVGYFPAHKPKYSAIVLIRNPRGWYQYGSNVAAPVFKEIADNIYARDIQLHEPMSLEGPIPENDVLPFIKAGNQQELTLVCNELGIANQPLTEDEWVRTSRTGNTVNWKKNTQSEGTVPDVSGMTFRDALYLLERSGLEVIYEGKGRVVNQSLHVGRRVSKGDRIYIKLG